MDPRLVSQLYLWLRTNQPPKNEYTSSKFVRHIPAAPLVSSEQADGGMSISVDEARGIANLIYTASGHISCIAKIRVNDLPTYGIKVVRGKE